MPTLIAPDARVRESFLSAMAEFQAEGRGTPDDDSMIAWEMRAYGEEWARAEAFERYTAQLRAQADPDRPRPKGRVASTTLWYVEGDEYLGRLAIRHELTDWLLQYGGHIGYDVRPTARRRGHATAMLREALPVARALGIESALITCDVDNVASRRVIEASGGELEDERGGKLRFWVPTATA
jgi:predicted acetyltransferase